MNKLFCLMTVFCISGCYTTAPTHWNEHHSHDVIQSRKSTPNGSRLELQAKTDRSFLLINSIEVPLCRTAESGYPVIKVSGSREAHTWPASLFGVGMLGLGTGLMVDGLGKDSDQTEAKIVETLGGIGALVTGAVVTGKYLLAGYEPETDMERKFRNGAGFRRWERDDRSDCIGGELKPIGNIPILLTTVWANSDQKIKWTKQFTNSTGVAPIPIMNTVRAISAHCGVATTIFKADALDSRSIEDTPDHPSSNRDESGVFEIKTQAGPLESPDLIKNETARRIAWGCAIDTQKKCAGSRSASITTKCKTDCNSMSGAGYCEEQKETELRMPDISADEKRQIDERYATCVTEHKVDTSSSDDCATKCIASALNVICPNPWDSK